MKLRKEVKIKKQEMKARLGRSKFRLGLIITGVLLVTNVMVTIFMSANGVELVSLEGEVAVLERESRELTAKLVGESSLSFVTDKVEELELIKPEIVVYLNFGEIVAAVNEN